MNEWLEMWNQWPEDVRSGLRIVLILMIASLAAFLVRRVLRGFRQLVTSRIEERDDRKRVDTLFRAFRATARALIWAIAAVLILDLLGFSITPILGAAGVAGIAIGFAAQNLVKDFFGGFFLLLENQIRRGDVVTIADRTGTVEDVTLRYVQLRDNDGHVHFIPNSQIGVVTNRTFDYAYAVVDIGVGYRESVEEALELMSLVGNEMRAVPEHGWRILEDIEIQGVERLADSAVILRARIKTQPGEQWNVKREYLRRLKNAFDAGGIEIPFPQLTVHASSQLATQPAKR